MHRIQRLLAASIIVLLASCRSRGQDLESSLAEAVANGHGTVVDLRTVAPYRWDRFHTFPPYTRPEQVEEALGFRWRGAARSGIESSDAINLLVFTTGEKVVAYVALPRSKGDFYRVGRKHGYSPDSARFVVRQEGQLSSGEPHLVLLPVP